MTSNQKSQRAERIRGRKGVRLRHRLLYNQPLCVHCLAQGRTELATERDHIVPLFKGGEDTEQNTQALCSTCHKAKTLDDLRGARASGSGGCDADGFPLDQEHPWAKGGR